MGWQHRPPRFSLAAAAVAILSLGAPCAHRDARASDTREPTAADDSECPEPEVVWAIIARIVPSATGELLAARSRVEIRDLGAQYRVRVSAPGGTTLERVYSDPARDCGRRAGFAAEFILVGLMPPHLAAEGPPPEALAAPPPKPPAAQSQPPPPDGKHVLRIELGAVGTAAPAVLGSPSVIAWGPDVRVCLGAGSLAAIAGVAYTPGANFVLSDLQGSVARVPAIVGLRARASRAPFEIAGDFGVVVAFERYAGTSPKMPRDATRLAPGIEAALLVSPGSLARLAPFASLRCMFAPLTNGLGVTPQGVVGKTPSLWIGAALGLSLAL